MDGQFQLLFDKMKIEMQNQTIELTNTILDKMEEKLKPILEENKILKLKVEKLEKKVERLERDKRSNNKTQEPMIKGRERNPHHRKPNYIQGNEKTLSSSKNNRINAFDMMRSRSHSLSTISTTMNQ
ncbi:unnamed protein product [Euphydryas editha]|uniref:Uncharacterized protein n=1 Tax=Euphydryas editha TaxID=104508 RepID=A0AAU9UAE3_EUPED|nr:unnamed protein product [Euphydryas editha]